MAAVVEQQQISIHQLLAPPELAQLQAEQFQARVIHLLDFLAAREVTVDLHHTQQITLHVQVVPVLQMQSL